eukprot:g22485.t1
MFPDVESWDEFQNYVTDLSRSVELELPRSPYAVAGAVGELERQRTTEGKEGKSLAESAKEIPGHAASQVSNLPEPPVGPETEPPEMVSSDDETTSEDEEEGEDDPMPTFAPDMNLLERWETRVRSRMVHDDRRDRLLANPPDLLHYVDDAYVHLAVRRPLSIYMAIEEEMNRPYFMELAGLRPLRPAVVTSPDKRSPAVEQKSKPDPLGKAYMVRGRGSRGSRSGSASRSPINPNNGRPLPGTFDHGPEAYAEPPPGLRHPSDEDESENKNNARGRCHGWGQSRTRCVYDRSMITNSQFESQRAAAAGWRETESSATITPTDGWNMRRTRRFGQLRNPQNWQLENFMVNRLPLVWEQSGIPRNRKVYRENVPYRTTLEAAKQYKLMAVETPGRQFDNDLKLIDWLLDRGPITPVITRVGGFSFATRSIPRAAPTEDGGPGPEKKDKPSPVKAVKSGDATTKRWSTGVSGGSPIKGSGAKIASRSGSNTPTKEPQPSRTTGASSSSSRRSLSPGHRTPTRGTAASSSSGTTTVKAEESAAGDRKRPATEDYPDDPLIYLENGSTPWRLYMGEDQSFSEDTTEPEQEAPAERKARRILPLAGESGDEEDTESEAQTPASKAGTGKTNSSTKKKSTLSNLQAVVAEIRNDKEYSEADIARIRGDLNDYLRDIKLFVTPTRPRHISDVDEKSLREALKQELDNLVTIWSELHVRDKRTVTLKEIKELKRVRDLVRAGKMWERVDLAPGQEEISDEERMQRVELLQTQIAEVNEARGRHKNRVLSPEEINDEADYELAWSEYVQLMYRP